jgi:hypothetical protein
VPASGDFQIKKIKFGVQDPDKGGSSGLRMRMALQWGGMIFMLFTLRVGDGFVFFT